jgi:hypothetical protein
VQLERLRYCSDILRQVPWKHWDVGDLVTGFLTPKLLTPDDYEKVAAKYRERQQAARQRAQELRQQQEQGAEHRGAREERRDR